MSNVRVKICGITSLADAKHAADCGADAIGFNFYAVSKRYISSPLAAEIVERVTMRVEKVGVFVNATVEEIVEIEDAVQLDAVQLHGDETPEFIEELRGESDATIIKAIRIGPDFDPNDVLQYKADAILLDAFSKVERGGTGETFDWAIASHLVILVDQVYLAGGLTPENVAEAIRVVGPYAVDVASGVEASPGMKDRDKVAAFIKAAKEAI
ncbi:MAG: phosphoribosylanthranilate isomerase [Pyrinomonadaceae bacterium]